jgi:hypothetical protein
VVLLIELQYFSPSIFYSELRRCEYCLFEQYEHFQKAGFTNRCMVAGANGVIQLTVPVEGGRNQKVPLQEVRVSRAENWQANHWKTLCSAYNRSPWFDHFRDELEQLYSRSYHFLLDWNLACFMWTCDKLSISSKHTFTESYQKDYEENVKDWRGRLRPSTINNNESSTTSYTQVFTERHGFIPNLSILDLLFCAGPAGLNLYNGFYSNR